MMLMPHVCVGLDPISFPLCAVKTAMQQLSEHLAPGVALH
jgi:hypothetical protein